MRKKLLQVRVSYEPNRLSGKYLTEAYQKCMPTIKQKMKAKEEFENKELMRNVGC